MIQQQREETLDESRPRLFVIRENKDIAPGRPGSLGYSIRNDSSVPGKIVRERLAMGWAPPLKIPEIGIFTFQAKYPFSRFQETPRNFLFGTGELPLVSGFNFNRQDIAEIYSGNFLGLIWELDYCDLKDIGSRCFTLHFHHAYNIQDGKVFENIQHQIDFEGPERRIGEAAHLAMINR